MPCCIPWEPVAPPPVRGMSPAPPPAWANAAPLVSESPATTARIDFFISSPPWLRRTVSPRLVPTTPSGSMRDGHAPAAADAPVAFDGRRRDTYNAPPHGYRSSQ